MSAGLMIGGKGVLLGGKAITREHSECCCECEHNCYLHPPDRWILRIIALIPGDDCAELDGVTTALILDTGGPPEANSVCLGPGGDEFGNIAQRWNEDGTTVPPVQFSFYICYTCGRLLSTGVEPGGCFNFDETALFLRTDGSDNPCDNLLVDLGAVGAASDPPSCGHCATNQRSRYVGLLTRGA